MSTNLKEQLHQMLANAKEVLNYCTPDEFPNVRSAVALAEEATEANDFMAMQKVYDELDSALSAYQKEIRLDARNPSFSDYTRPCYGH